MVQPQPTTSTFPINIRVLTRLRDGRTFIQEGAASYDGRTWKDGVEALRTHVFHRFWAPTCLVTLAALSPEDATKEEHVILQGLGTRWIKLPPGFVSDAVNNDLSGGELSFLRKGLLGWLRPFYVTENKAAAFTDVHGREVVFQHDAEKGFSIRIQGNDPPLAPQLDAAGASSGEFVFCLDVEEAEPLAVSRTIHKIAYLALCVFDPDLALSPLLDDARVLIRDGLADQFRPYCERFEPGAWPGFHLVLQVEACQIGEGEAEVDRLVVCLRLHHATYTFSLAGRPFEPPEDAEVARYDQPAGSKRGRREITWRFGRIEERR
jgi:hypothetical protein